MVSKMIILAFAQQPLKTTFEHTSKTDKKNIKKNQKFEVSWKILNKGEQFSPITENSTLCIKEKFHIIFNPESADINSRDELFGGRRSSWLAFNWQ